MLLKCSLSWKEMNAGNISSEKELILGLVEV